MTAKGPIHAAIAYFGKDGSQILPLRAGDTLLVDMSLRAVRQGVTDPREIKKLLRRNVEVYSREGLHAKFVCIGKTLICGSANASSRSRDSLDEAALLIADSSLVRTAKIYLKSMCTEPVSEPYLEQCLKEYKPPWFTAARGTVRLKRRSSDAKVWIVGGVREIELPKQDQPTVLELESAEKASLPKQRYEVRWIRYRKKPSYFGSLRPGNWVITVMVGYNGRRSVSGPAQVLSKRQYRSSRGALFHMLMLASPTQSTPMSLSEFRKKVGRISPDFAGPRIRTRPFTNREVGDAVLRLWTPNGKPRGGYRS